MEKTEGIRENRIRKIVHKSVSLETGRNLGRFIDSSHYSNSYPRTQRTILFCLLLLGKRTTKKGQRRYEKYENENRC